MKKNKILISFIVLALLLCAFVGITLYTSILSYMEVSSQAELKINGMIDTLNRVQANIDALEAEFRVRTENTMEMMSIALRPLIHGETYEGPTIFEDGVVVQIANNKLIYPDEFSGRFELLSENPDVSQLENMTLTTLIDEPDNTRPVLISGKWIAGDFYYVDWWEMDDYQSSINYEKPIGEAVSTLEQLYDASLLLLDSTDENLPILYSSKALGTAENIGDLGITKEDIDAKTASLTINKKTYSAAYEDLQGFDRSAKAIVLLNPIESNNYIINCIIIAAGFILLCVTILILWIHWIEVYSRDHELTEAQQKAWQPSRLRKTTASISLNGAILLFVILIGYQLLGNISRISHSNQESLDIMIARLENSSKGVSSSKNEAEEWGVYFARRIADLYSRVPECRNQEYLKKANELIGSEYIMIFDGKGKELLSSNGYVGFTLGDGVISNKDFLYLLQGISHIIGEPRTEKFSGKELQMIGSEMNLEEKDAYGAVLLAFDPQKTWKTAGTKEIENYVNMITHQGNLSLVISKASGKVVYSSNSDLVGKEPAEFGLEYTNLTPISLEAFEVMGAKRFGAFSEDAQYHYFYMTDSEYIWGDSVKFAVFSALYYMCTCLVISIILLGTFRLNLTESTEQFKTILKKKPTFSKNQDVLTTFQETERGDRSFKEWWHDLTPEQKTVQLLKLAVTLILLATIIFLLSKGELGSKSVFNFIMRGSWKRGVNELSVTAIIGCLILLFSFILFKDLLVRILSSMFNAKGRTIVGLVSSLLQYVAIITAVFFCLSYLGFDTGVLVTSASILTLAISLGSKDLIADILSGIFIIFEGDFQVGDVIEINGFKGRVMDIGVRSTKLKDAGNNIKIIDNQSVKNILNLSKETSWVFIELTLLNTQPIDEITKMLERELPKIGEQNPKIISGPHYFGISKIGYHTLTIGIGVSCHQNDSAIVKNYMNARLFELFRDNGFRL